MDHAHKLLYFLTLWCLVYYRCIATNSILGQSVVVGGTVELHCTLVVNSTLDENFSFSWSVVRATNASTFYTQCGDQLKADFPAITEGRYNSTYDVMRNGTKVSHFCSLIITEVTLDDAGSYGCTLNLSGNSSVSEVNTDPIELSVIHCSASTTEDINLITIKNGIKFRFICNASGYPRHLTWFDSNQEMLSVVGDESRLVHTLHPSDNGRMFFCVDNSSLGLLNHDVRCSVSPMRIPPLVNMSSGLKLVAMEGVEINLTCTGIGASNVTGYSWYHKNESISSNDERFDIKTTRTFSESTLITKAIADYNNTYFKCKVHTEIWTGLSASSSTMLVVMTDNALRVNTINPDNLETMPVYITATISLAGILLIMAVISLFVFKRHKYQSTTDIEKTKKDRPNSERNVELTANGAYAPNNTDTLIHNISAQMDQEPSFEFLENPQICNRRKSSLFRESFQDLWLANATRIDEDNISDASSVSLPSFAAVSRSRPDLDLNHFDEPMTATRSHPTLETRASAPAGLYSSRGSNALKEKNSYKTDIKENENETMSELDTDKRIPDEKHNFEISGSQEIELTKKMLTKEEIINSYLSKLSIPAVEISPSEVV